MRLFNKVTIIGVGLIGGSIGLAVRKRKLAREVIGVFRRRSTLKKALRRRAVDRATMSIADGVKDADLVVVASPVLSIPSLVSEAAKYAKTGAIITDAGSTKQWIVKRAERSVSKRNGLRFVGSHPMAGSEHTSVDYARADLMEGAACIVTRTQKTDAFTLKKVTTFWKALGCRVMIMSPASHDAGVANISHLPHIAAFGVAGSVDTGDLKLAAEGFKDTTRVASSDPALWADIFLTNKKEVARAGATFTRKLRDILKLISASDRKGLIKILRSAKDKRDKFNDYCH